MTYLLRLVTFIEGEPLIDADHLAAPVLYALGDVAGQVARALEDFEHAGLPIARMQWDPRHVGAVVEALAPHVEDPRRRELVAGVATAAAEAIERLAPRLPRQIVHCDVTDWNVIGRRDRAGRLMPCGVIDFGDVTRTLRVCELAVAASIAFGHDPDDPICAAAEIVRGFDAACPLDDAELEALPHLIAARAAIVAVGTEQQALLEPHNDYAQRVRAGDWAICEAAAAVPLALAEAAFRLACGRDAAALAPRVPAGTLAAPGRRAAVACGRRSRPAPALDPALARCGRRARRPRRGALPRDPRALARRAGDGAPRPRRLRARGQRGARAARRARRARAASASSCSRPTVSRCAWPGSRRRWRAGEQVAAGAAVGHLRRGRTRCRCISTCRSHRRALTALPGLVDPGARGSVARAVPASRRRCSGSRSPARADGRARRRAAAP